MNNPPNRSGAGNAHPAPLSDLRVAGALHRQSNIGMAW